MWSNHVNPTFGLYFSEKAGYFPDFIVPIYCIHKVQLVSTDKVWMYEEIMMNDDNVESNLPTSSSLKMCSLYKLNWRSVTV